MDSFEVFVEKMKKHVDKMINEVRLKNTKLLFISDVDKDLLWATYLNSFPPSEQAVFRKRASHDCGSCRNFIKNFGNVVSLIDGKITTAWDFDMEGTIYEQVVKNLSDLVKSSPIQNTFISREVSFGIPYNKEIDENHNLVATWTHLHYNLPKVFSYSKPDTIDTEKSRFRTNKEVFKRSLEEIKVDAVQSVLELIGENSLYKGEENKSLLEEFKRLVEKYNHIKDEKQKDLFCWEKAVLLSEPILRIKNHAIGTLLLDISQGKDFEEAVRAYEAMVAPSNYRRPKAVFTAKMLQDAKKKIVELGFESALERRFASIDDITINNILFADREAIKRIKKNDPLSALDEDIGQNPKNFKKVEEIHIEDFIKNVLPNIKKMEVLMESHHKSNLVSLIAPKVQDSKNMFKWSNNFSWAYKGNMTDSMKERVKSLGGKVDGDLRFSIQWNEDGDNHNDFDAHCIQPNGEEICYYHKKDPQTGGFLDIDVINPHGIAVENISWPHREQMRIGTYEFFVHNFNHRGGRAGFKAEIEMDGTIYSFNYNKELRQGEKVKVALVKFDKIKGFSLQSNLDMETTPENIWGISTNIFTPVSVCMYSPNYWDEQDGIGNKHYFFMLKNCVSEETPNGFYNEFLIPELTPHRKVFESLGSKLQIDKVENELSGLGFSSTQRNTLTCKVEGSIIRMLKILF